MDRTLGTFFSAFVRIIWFILYFLYYYFSYIVFYIKSSWTLVTRSVSMVAAATPALAGPNISCIATLMK